MSGSERAEGCDSPPPLTFNAAGGAVLAWSPRSSKLSGTLFLTFLWTALRCRCRLVGEALEPRRDVHSIAVDLLTG